MPTRDELNVLLIAIVSTVAASEGGEAPEGPMYAAMMNRCDIETWNLLKHLVIESGLCERRGNHVLGITAKGREMARQIDEFAKKGN